MVGNGSGILAELLPTPAEKDHHADYAAELFDASADNFDRHLTGKLGYRTPDLIRYILLTLPDNGNTGGNVLDAGCGTGLMGALLAGRTRTLTGVDVSKK